MVVKSKIYTRVIHTKFNNLVFEGATVELKKTLHT